MQADEVKKILESHKLWLWGRGGERAYLHGANLRGANLSATVGNMREVKTLLIDTWVVTYTKTDMAIGCKQYSIDEWFAFDDSEISKMDRDALEWWSKWKPILKAIILDK